MPKISLLIHTASDDAFLQGQGILSYFNAVTQNLCKQTFKDFELVYVDTFFEDNQEEFSKLIANLPFTVKHVTIHPNHRYWYDKGYVYISAAKNTGILYADGNLLISCDDAEFFPEKLLETYWLHYKDGYLMHAVHKRMKSIKTNNGVPLFPIDGDIYINDHRLSSATKKVRRHQHGSQLFAGTSFSLEDALQINGFNEKMDSCKSLEDCDFGNRLALIGKTFTIDTDGFAYILDHPSYFDAVKTTGSEAQLTEPVPVKNLKQKQILNLIAVENHGLLRCAEELFEHQANKYPLTQKHFDIIKRDTLRFRFFDPFAPENKEKLDLWLGTPNFNLRKEREELRKSTDWKW